MYGFLPFDIYKTQLSVDRASLVIYHDDTVDRYNVNSGGLKGNDLRKKLNDFVRANYRGKSCRVQYAEHLVDLMVS